MKKLVTMMMAAVIAFAMLTGCGNTEAADSEVKDLSASVSTDGSTSMEKVIGALGEAFQNDTGISFTYNPTGSGSGIKAVQEGRCDIGLSSRDLKEEEKASGLIGTVLAYDGIAIIVNPENPVEDLSNETTIKDGSYVVQRPFVLVTKADTELSVAAQKFFDYITSADANEIISAAGVVSVN